MVIARRPHPIPSRTRKLSSLAPMVLHDFLCGRVGRRRVFSKGRRARLNTYSAAFFYAISPTVRTHLVLDVPQGTPAESGACRRPISHKLRLHWYGVESIPAASGRIRVLNVGCGLFLFGRLQRTRAVRPRRTSRYACGIWALPSADLTQTKTTKVHYVNGFILAKGSLIYLCSPL